jgi:hypothetical protein
MSIFKTRENKKFSYTPRYYKRDGGNNPFKIEGKFDQYRSTIENPSGIKGKLVKAVNEWKTSQDRTNEKRVFLIALVLLVLFLWLIDFDFSIFFN